MGISWHPDIPEPPPATREQLRRELPGVLLWIPLAFVAGVVVGVVFLDLYAGQPEDGPHQATTAGPAPSTTAAHATTARDPRTTRSTP
jgi:hypothetical protein